MPSVAQESPTVQSSKKRRRDDNFDNTHQIPFSLGTTTGPRGIFTDKPFDHGAVFQHRHSSPSATRRLIPLPLGKRQRTTVDIDVGADGDPMQRSPSDSSPRRSDPPHHHHHQQEPQQRDHHQPKDAPRQDLNDKIRSATAATVPSLMSRCHICSRKPNKKSDLDSFADCQGCGQRACYVCIRECLGWAPNIPTATTTTALHHTRTPAANPPAATATIPTPVEDGDGETSFTMLDADAAEDHRPASSEAPETGHEHGWTRGGGHRQVVCSRCCVEKGQDGDVVCLGCLPFVEG